MAVNFRIVLASLLVFLIFLSPTFAEQQTNMPGLDEGVNNIEVFGALGSTTINGVSYQYFSLRPDIPIWKFGIGLDISLYFDNDGNLREEDWDEAKDYIEKIHYIRYGRPGEAFYARVGSLSPITLGYGLGMRRYTNAIEWPQEKRIGLQTELNLSHLRLHAVVNNFREIDSPGLLGARLAYKIALPIRPLWIGGTVLHDGNQYLGADDEDDDGIPDRQDMYPGDNDGDKITELRGLLPDHKIRELIEGGFLPNVLNPPSSIKDREGEITEFIIDAGIPLIDGEMVNLWVYAQAAQIVDYGRGYTVPGVMFNVQLLENLGLRSLAEYRIFEEEFTGDFFNYSYEVERVTWDEASDSYLTKSDKLEGVPAAQGFYADLGIDVLGWIDVFGAYQQMQYDDDRPNKSFYSVAKLLKTDRIPKIDLLEGYFQQPNVDKLFSTKSDGTAIGYRIGASMGGGVMLVYDYRTIYYNGEPNRIMTIETVFKF